MTVEGKREGRSQSLAPNKILPPLKLINWTLKKLNEEIASAQKERRKIR